MALILTTLPPYQVSEIEKQLFAYGLGPDKVELGVKNNTRCDPLAPRD